MKKGDTIFVGEYALAIKQQVGRQGYIAQQDGVDYFVKVYNTRKMFAHGYWQRELLIHELLGKHPNIISPIGANRVRDIALTVFPFVQGETYESKRGLSLRQQADIATDLANTLGAAHDKKIYHNDITPMNILLGEQTYLLDWEAAHQDGMTSVDPGRFLSTAGYASPRRIRTTQLGSVEEDTFGLAATMYFGLTGVRLYEEYNRNFKFVPVKPSLHNPSLPSSIDTVLRRGLVFNNDMILSPAEFATEMRRAALAPVSVNVR